LDSEHLKFLERTIKMPRYLSSLTHGIATPLEVQMASHETSFLGPMRKQHDFLNINYHIFVSGSRSLQRLLNI